MRKVYLPNRFGHCANDHHHLVSGAGFANRFARGRENFRRVGDARSAELLHDQRHLSCSFRKGETDCVEKRRENGRVDRLALSNVVCRSTRPSIRLA